MMKNLLLKSLIVTCVTGVAVLLTPKTSVAQVNPSFLTEVAESCQKDVSSSEYYQQMGYKKGTIPNSRSVNFYLGHCIKARYFYLKIISELPWLVSSGEMLPGYPGVVAVSIIAYDMSPNPGFSDTFFTRQGSYFLDCLASLDASSRECLNNPLQGLYLHYVDKSWKFDLFKTHPNRYAVQSAFYAYMCPSCFVAYNNSPSGIKMTDAFIKWFTKLEPSRKKELMSILGGEKAQGNNRVNMKREAEQAVEEYTAIRRRMAEEEKERRRRELFE